MALQYFQNTSIKPWMNIGCDQIVCNSLMAANITFNTGSNSVILPNNRGTNGQVLTSNGTGLSTWAFPALINGNAYFDGFGNSLVGGSFNFTSVQPLRTNSQFNNGMVLLNSGLQIPKTGIYYCFATIRFEVPFDEATFCVGFGLNNIAQLDFLGVSVVASTPYSLNSSTVISASLNDNLSIMLAQASSTPQTATVTYWGLSAYCIQ